MMLTIMLPLVALFSGAKTLGWDTQKFGKHFLKTLGRFLPCPSVSFGKRKFYKCSLEKLKWRQWKGFL
jgi:hypothetical protein